MAFDAGGQDAEAALLARYAQGDRAAAAILVGRLAPGALSLARRLLGDGAEAEDVTQEALLRLWKIAPDWETGRAKVSTWLYRVVVNLCTDRRRRRRPEPVADLPEQADGSPAPVEHLQMQARLNALGEALDALPERQRLAVVMRDIEGLANPEIGAILGVSVEAVESLAARGRRALKARLGGRRSELGFDDD
ncbi:MAG: sigma-70 family RNA polymerase sigma factor [Rhodobacteraceae bacterium]|nr:sigma-70 family RNA polymerase sigma factor [Paracoccaceae bacterium]